MLVILFIQHVMSLVIQRIVKIVTNCNRSTGSTSLFLPNVISFAPGLTSYPYWRWPSFGVRDSILKLISKQTPIPRIFWGRFPCGALLDPEASSDKWHSWWQSVSSKCIFPGFPHCILDKEVEHLEAMKDLFIGNPATTRRKWASLSSRDENKI